VSERLTAFSDGVVAIAITLLALELPVPRGGTNAAVLSEIAEHRPEYLTFLISFAVVGGQWFSHHRLFAHVERASGRLVAWNMVWLLTIVVTPFATRMLTTDGAFEVRFISYAAVQALCGLCLGLMLWEIARHDLYKPDTPPGWLTDTGRRVAVITSAFLVSIPVAFATHAAYACWLVVPLLVRAITRVAGQRRR
jgi:TMEM175 potassium channel family protein